jgi:hypothetical protein
VEENGNRPEAYRFFPGAGGSEKGAAILESFAGPDQLQRNFFCEQAVNTAWTK